MKVLLIASDKNELKDFDNRFIKAVCGVGPILSSAITALELSRTNADIVVSIGSSGAVAPSLEIGKAYSFSRVVTPDQNLSSLHVSLGNTLDANRTTVGELFSADRVSSLTLGTSGTFNKSLQLWHSSLHVDAADMEGYGVAIAAKSCNVPFYAVKLITDRVGDNSSIGKIQFNLRDSRESLISLVESLVF